MALFNRDRRRPEEEGAGGGLGSGRSTETMAGGPMRASAPTKYGPMRASAPTTGTMAMGGRPMSAPTATMGAGPMAISGRSMSAPTAGALGVMAAEQAAMVQPIGVEQIRKAMETLRKYKAGKANFEKRIIENEQWWKMRHWDLFKERGTTTLKAKSAWLVNVILSKHADAMDALPEPNCLPRQRDDEPEADILSKVVPVVLQQNDFDLTWSDNWWKKLKAGVAFYGVFWDSKALNGLGEVVVRKIDPLTLYWEPGITDLQASRNIFQVTLVDNELLAEEYPELRGELGTKAFAVNEYLYDDTVPTQDKSPVIDWYYKKQVSSKTVLHYCKFVGEHVLFASENEAGSVNPSTTSWSPSPMAADRGNMGGFAGSAGTMGATAAGYGTAGTEGTQPLTEDGSGGFAPPGADAMTERGWYDHGMYPYFADVLFPEEGTPTGYGYIDICKDSQRQIDLMNNSIVANCIWGATPRWLVRQEGAVNEEEFADWTKPFVHVNGLMDERFLQQIQVQPLTGNYMNILESKIAEMKETSGNRDVNNGGAPSGVTAASAIAAMQEQSGKLSRDQIQNSYNCYRQIVLCVIELIRQFYKVPRWFRILGPEGAAQYVQFSNSGLIVQQQGVDPILQMPVEHIRKPVFDIEVSAQRQSAYNKMSQNELALQFYQLGFFEPERADQSMAALDMMDFRGKEKIRQRIEQNGGMLQMIQQLMMQIQMLTGGAAGGPQEGAGAPMAAGAAGTPAPGGGSSGDVKIGENDASGQPRQQNRYVEGAKAKAQAATQPR